MKSPREMRQCQFPNGNVVGNPKTQATPFKIIPLAMSIPDFTKVEDLLDTLEIIDTLEGPDRRW